MCENKLWNQLRQRIVHLTPFGPSPIFNYEVCLESISMDPQIGRVLYIVLDVGAELWKKNAIIICATQIRFNLLQTFATME